MKKNKYIFVLLLLVAISALAFGSTFLYVKENNEKAYDGQLVVMTSCNPMYIATLNVTKGIDGVIVENLSQPTTGCLHDYSLTAQDMKNLSHADILVVNGRGMEGYLADVMMAYPELPILRASEVVSFIGATDFADDLNELLEENSHTWMANHVYIAEVGAIAQTMAELDSDNADAYKANATAYTDELIEQLSDAIENTAKKADGGNVAILHEAYEYIALDLGMHVVATMDLDEERQVSAGEVAELLDSIRDNDVHLAFAERDYGQSMGELIEEQTDAHVVYLNTLIHGTFDGDDYQKVMANNYAIISEVLNASHDHEHDHDSDEHDEH